MQIENLKAICYLNPKDIRKPEKNINVRNRNYETYGSNIMNRDLLSRRQYIKILAQPRRISYLSNILKSHKKRTLPKITPRLLLLSLPPKWKILNNWQYYQKILPSYRFERMIDTLLKKDGRFELSEMFLCKKNTRIKNRENKRKLSTKICKKNSEILDVITSLADFLMTPNTWMLSKTQKKIFDYIICYLIEANLWKYECKKLKRESTEMEFILAIIKCTIFVTCILCTMNNIDFQESKLSDAEIYEAHSESTRTNVESDHSHDNDFEKKAQTEFKTEQKFKDKVNKEKTKSLPKNKNKSLPKNVTANNNFTHHPASTVSSILKRIIDIDERNMVETYVQTPTIETVSKFTSTTKGDVCHLLDCERNDRLLSEIRKFYKKRIDLHDKHVFDDVLLPKITLNEIMKYAELVLANQVIAVRPTRHLQNSFQMKIVGWVQEILSIDAWDDCMKCDIKLLSYELARYITEEKNHYEMKQQEYTNNTNIVILPKNTVQEGYTNQLKLRPSKIRGTDLNVQHFLDITPHKSGVICCASLKVWSAWIKDVAENAKLWCIWINQIISNMSYLSAIIRGEVYDEGGNPLNLFSCDWKQFISNLDDDIAAWRQYNNHIQSLTDQLTAAFHGKRIKCCQCCKDENLHISDDGIKHLYRKIWDAMETTKNWRHWLQEMVNEAKQLTCISEDRCLCHIPMFEISPVRNNNKEQNVCNNSVGCPLVPFEKIFIEKDPSIYSIEHWTIDDLY